MVGFRRARLFAAGLAVAAAAAAQTSSPTPQAKKPFSFPAPTGLPAAPTPAAPAPAKNYPELKPYDSCDFPDGLRVTDVSAMPAEVHERPVQMHGVTKSVPLLGGRRVTFAYPGGQPYASVKVELLPAENYAANRRLLLDDFDDIVASDKHVARSARKPLLNGFFIEGLDRDSLEGNTLGIYLLLDDRTHVASTIYLLNADPAQRKFKTPAEYSSMRDTFLYNYTRCIRNNQTGSLFGGTK